MRNEIIVDMNARDLAAQKVATPVQQIVHNYHQFITPAPREVHHHIETPIRIPIPAVPANERASDHLRNTGQTFQHFFMQHNPTTIHLNLPKRGEEIPIQYSPPPRVPDAVLGEDTPYGPVKLAKARYRPFEGAPLPAPAGGATAPEPVRIKKPQPENEKINNQKRN